MRVVGVGGADVIVEHEPDHPAVLGEDKLAEAEGQGGEDAITLLLQELGA